MRAVALMVAWMLASAAHGAEGHRSFHVGHSLASGPLGMFLIEAAAQAGATHESAMQLRWGTSPMGNWQEHAHPQAGVDGWPVLAGGSCDTFVITPGPGMLEEIFARTDPAYAASWLVLATTGRLPSGPRTELGPGNPRIRSYVYHIWPAIDAPPEQWYGLVIDTRAQCETIADEMAAACPTAPSPRVLPVAEAFAELFSRIEAGEVPGYHDRSELFHLPDTIHVDDVGMYLSALVHFCAMYGRDATGFGGGSPGLTQPVRAILQDIAWRAVTSDPRSGVPSVPRAPRLLWSGGRTQLFAGQRLRLSAFATGCPQPRCQWQRDGVDIPGATLCRFERIVTRSDDGSRLRCVISNESGELTSPEQVLAVAEPPEHVALEELPASVSRSGYGPVRSEHEVAAAALTVAKTAHEHGLTAKAPVELRYDLHGAGVSLTAQVGVADGSPPGTALIFEAWADGQRILASDPIAVGAPAQPVTVALAGAEQVTLLARIAPGSPDGAGAVWAEPILTRVPGASLPIPERMERRHAPLEGIRFGAVPAGFEQRAWFAESPGWSNAAVATVVSCGDARALEVVAPDQGSRDKAVLSKTVDWSVADHPALVFTVANRCRQPTRLAIAVKTGDTERYFESQGQDVPPGPALQQLRFDLASASWKCADSAWKYTVPVADLASVSQVMLLVYNGDQEADVLIRGMRWE
jgi:hypothetical protein